MAAIDNIGFESVIEFKNNKIEQLKKINKDIRTIEKLLKTKDSLLGFMFNWI